MMDDELTLEQKRELVRRQYGDGSDLARTAEERANKSGRANNAGTRNKTAPAAPAIAARQSKRATTGRKFEEELDETHLALENRGEGLILPHYPPTVMVGRSSGVPRLHYRRGGGPCDYSGHVNLRRTDNAMLASIADTYGRSQVPVVFDAKVLDDDHASYSHDPERMRQLDHLLRAYAAGAAAFLLVRALERVYLVAGRPLLEALRGGGSVTLYRRERAADVIERRLGRSRAIPSYKMDTILPSVTYLPGRGWDWTAILHHAVSHIGPAEAAKLTADRR